MSTNWTAAGRDAAKAFRPTLGDEPVDLVTARDKMEYRLFFDDAVTGAALRALSMPGRRTALDTAFAAFCAELAGA